MITNYVPANWITAYVAAISAWVAITNGATLPSNWLTLPTGQPPPPVAWYVATTGNDGNPGTSNQPLRTIQAAVNLCQPGEYVVVQPGIYAGFNMVRDGTSVSNITVYGNGAVTINSRCAQTTDNFNNEGYDYIFIHSIISSNSTRYGFRSVNSIGCTFSNLVARNPGMTGLLTSKATGVQVLNCVFSGAGTEHGLYLSQSAATTNDSPVVRGVECYGNAGNGIQLNGSTSASVADNWIDNALLENCFIWSNGVKGLSLIGVRWGTFQNNRVVSNHVSGSGAAGIHLSDQACALSICTNYSQFNVICNNTIIEPGMVPVRISSGSGPTYGSVSNVLFNNFSVKSSGSWIVDEVGTNFTNTPSNVKVTSATGEFDDSAFHLSAISTALEQGTNTFMGYSAPSADFEGTSRPQGTYNDSGADER